VILVLLAIVTNLVARIIVKWWSFKLSRWIWFEMIDRQFKATLRYYDETLVGKVINRFSLDSNNAETSGIKDTVTLLNTLLGNVKFVITQLLVSWYIMVVYFPSFYFIWKLQDLQLKSSRQMKRIAAVLRSPVIEKANAIVEGSASMRAFGIERRIIGDFNTAIKNNACARVWSIYMASWITLWIGIIGVIFVGIAAFFSLVACLNGYVNPALMGVALLYSMQVVRQISNLTKQYAKMEQTFNAVERLYQVLDGTPQEPDHPTAVPRPNWPQYGFIKIRDLVCRYAPHLDDVLKGVSFDICAGHKIGVCGRTGSGKSSLTLAIIRLLETKGGSITIDGINVGEISLKKLRDVVTMVPQEPVLFEGTIRENIDPQNVKTDEELWTALEIALAKDFVSEMPEGLDTHVCDDGENMSKGQRQLLCFARAFLRNTRIFILDEATAALDAETDQRLQRVIADRFKQCTVITVAHRVNTIIDCDMILGLDSGLVMEYDTPQNLMATEGSLFRTLVQTSYS